MPRFGEAEVVVANSEIGLPDRFVAEAVRAVLRGERRTARIAVTFLGKRPMQRLNAMHLRHDQPTDVISFPLSGPGTELTGDIYICRHVAARAARAHGASTREELVRLVVHGTLHVLGWDHPAGTSRLKSPMWRRQEKYVKGLA
jgi:probable rRNA maturation factor